MLISKYGNGSKELVSEFESRLGIELDEEYEKYKDMVQEKVIL